MTIDTKHTEKEECESINSDEHQQNGVKELEFQAKYRRKDWPKLYSNRDFLVLYVSEDDPTMQVVRPADAPEHRKSMESGGGHYALSHLWGNAKGFPLWDVGAFITDGAGQPVDPIPMRPEKRETLLALLKAYPGYWWIDVLCARVDTPLVIMGSIYRSCKTCYTMVDCSVTTIRTLSKQRLEALMHDIMSTSIPYYKVSFKAACDGCDQDTVLELMAPLARAHVNMLIKHKDEIEAMRDLLECRWFDRVWTLQELVLPTKVVVVAEQQVTCESGQSDITQDQLDFEYVNDTGNNLKSDDFEMYLDDALLSKYRSGHADTVEHVVQKMDSFLEGSFINNSELSAATQINQIHEVLQSVAASSRTCLDPLDYVYGILGLIHVDIPRMDDPNTLWKLFVSELEARIAALAKDVNQGTVSLEISYSSADAVDLSSATNISDVYTGLVEFDIDEHAYGSILEDTKKLARLAPQLGVPTQLCNELSSFLDFTSETLKRIA